MIGKNVRRPKMDERNSLGKLIKNISQSFFTLAGNVIHLTALETRLAMRSVGYIFFSLFILGSLLTTLWIILFAIILLTLEKLHLSLLASLSIVLLINILCLLCIGLAIKKFQHNLTFPATRKQLGLASSKEIKNESTSVANQKA